MTRLVTAGLIVGTVFIPLFDSARPAIARWILADEQQAAFRASRRSYTTTQFSTFVRLIARQHSPVRVQT